MQTEKYAHTHTSTRSFIPLLPHIHAHMCTNTHTTIQIHADITTFIHDNKNQQHTSQHTYQHAHMHMQMNNITSQASQTQFHTNPGKAELVAEGTFGGESQEFITDPVPAGAPDGMGELADEDVTEGVMLKISTSSCMLRSVMVARSTKETEVAGAAPHGSGS